MYWPRLDCEELGIVSDDSLLYRLLRVAGRSLERSIAGGLLTVEAEPPPGCHSRVARTFHGAEERPSSVHEFEIVCQFVSLSESFKLTHGPPGMVKNHSRSWISVAFAARPPGLKRS
jgi:hypothetical protein